MTEDVVSKLSPSPEPSTSEADAVELRFGEGGHLLLTENGLSITGKRRPVWMKPNPN
jgi:hypothetical protein